MLKKLPLIFLALIVFAASLIFLLPAPSRGVAVAVVDLRAGQTIQTGDLVLRELPQDAIATDSVIDLSLAVGQTLRVDRSVGDVIRASHLGEPVSLAPNERAVSVSVVDSTGAAGLLRPGLRVGVVAIVSSEGFSSSGWFTKATVEGLRVLYVDPRWSSEQSSAPQPTQEGGAFGGTFTQDRAREGTVVLAVPVEMQTLLYDFAASGSESQAQRVNVIEMLTALTATDGAKLSLYLMPGEQAQAFTSPGLWMPDLIKTPGPTPTPTLAPGAIPGGGN